MNSCSLVCRKCTVEKVLRWDLTLYFQLITSSWHFCLALEMKSVQCLPDMTRDQPQVGSMHIPTVTFYHFDSKHFTPSMPQSFSFSLLLINQSAGRKIFNGLALFVTARKKTGGSEDDNETLDDSDVPRVVCCQCLWALLLFLLPLISCRSSQDILLLLHRG